MNGGLLQPGSGRLGHALHPAVGTFKVPQSASDRVINHVMARLRKAASSRLETFSPTGEGALPASPFSSVP